MKAAVVNAFGAGFNQEEVEISDPVGQEVLVEVRASGLCHTDLTLSRNNLGWPIPAVFGHELAGVVTAIGPDVTDFTIGDHVVGCLIQHCGRCPNCLASKPFQCRNPGASLRPSAEGSRLQRRGEPLNQGFGLGGFAEQALVHQNQLVTVPASVPFPQAALLGCGVVTGAGAVINSAQVQAGDSVVIIGAGGVGLNAVSGAQIAGATRIVAIDVQDGKLEKAQTFGATDVINSTALDPVAAVLELTEGGADHVFDFVGIQSVTEQALAMLSVGGGLYLVGMELAGTQFNVDIFSTVSRQRKIQGVRMGSSNFKHDIPMFADLYLQGRMNLDDLVSRQISLDEIDAGYESLKDSTTVRVVVTSF
jgi:S-(hydroxymethyl)glutathione dehydrogenase/alcohol dehydrogenase